MPRAYLPILFDRKVVSAKPILSRASVKKKKFSAKIETFLKIF
jgi:hypothetical protein